LVDGYFEQADESVQAADGAPHIGDNPGIQRGRIAVEFLLVGGPLEDNLAAKGAQLLDRRFPRELQLHLTFGHGERGLDYLTVALDSRAAEKELARDPLALFFPGAEVLDDFG
jgi:hypothetical protein